MYCDNVPAHILDDFRCHVLSLAVQLPGVDGSPLASIQQVPRELETW
jgi:hypothetical protein